MIDKIYTDYIPINTFSRPGKKLKEKKGIVIHWVGNPGTSAGQNLNYFKQLAKQNLGDDVKDRYAGSHYIVDDNMIIKTMEDDELTYHVGAYNYMDGVQEKIGSYPNSYLIGIEVCHPDWFGNFSRETIKNLCYLTKYLMLRYGLSIDNVYRHYDITGKMCPKYYVKHSQKWDQLKKEIENYIL